MKVKLSVCITCFNKEEYIDEAVKSITDQTVKPIEIILVHDGCQNPAHHPLCKTLILPKNTGVANARREAAKMASGALLLFLDGDDKLSPNFIEETVRLMEKADVAYPDMLWWYQGMGDNKYVYSPDKLLAKDMYNTCKIPVSCVMKRRVFDGLGGFRQLELYEDWDFWLRAMEAGYKFKRANTFLWYRQFPNTRNRQNKELKQEIYKKIRNQFVLSKGKICPRLSTTS
ncbi:MAG: hypothetical protein IFNCLDLE_02675 [Ignavibacteriaceae bacterium]|nr:hypothetical protein [Ignavibacteriaceae bacterium]